MLIYAYNVMSNPSLSSLPGAAPRPYWNPYAIGAGIGILSWIVFAVVNQPLGISTSLSAVSSTCALPILGSEGVAANAYWKKTPLQLDYGTLFLVGTFLGALVAALLSRSFRLETVPSVWAERFGAGSGLSRLLVAFLGGALVMVGARLAGGCTSGHGISGSLQLAVSSWVFFLTLFAAGLVTARLVFGRNRA